MLKYKIKRMMILFMLLIIVLLVCDYLIVLSKPLKCYDKQTYIKPAEKALLSFPELNDCRIQFISAGKRKIAHQAVPKLSTLILPKKYRVYKIIIADDQYGKLDSTLFKNLNYNSQVGVLGHELSHIYDYTTKNSFQMIMKGLNYYTSKDYRIKYERSTNCEAINRQLMENILSWSNETHEYLKEDGRGDYYHSPDELLTGDICK